MLNYIDQAETRLAQYFSSIKRNYEQKQNDDKGECEKNKETTSMLSYFESNLSKMKKDILYLRDKFMTITDIIQAFGEAMEERIKNVQKENHKNDQRISSLEEVSSKQMKLLEEQTQTQKQLIRKAVEEELSQIKDQRISSLEEVSSKQMKSLLEEQKQTQKQLIRKAVKEELSQIKETERKDKGRNCKVRKTKEEAQDDYFFRTVSLSQIPNYDYSLSQRENAGRLLRMLNMEFQMSMVEKVSFSGDKRKMRLTYWQIKDAKNGLKTMVARKKNCSNLSSLVVVRMCPPRLFNQQKELYDKAVREKRQGLCRHFFLYLCEENLEAKLLMTDGTSKVLKATTILT